MAEEGKTELPPDAMPITEAAALLGLTPERIRQLGRAGYATLPARGVVSLTSLLSGYAAFLKAEAAAPESAAASRAHDAKAALIENATDKRRADLVKRTEAEEALALIRAAAVRHLRGMTTARALRGLSPDLCAALRREVAGAVERIEAREAEARAALLSGELESLVEGGGAR